jgi:hypothetical protein
MSAFLPFNPSYGTGQTVAAGAAADAGALRKGDKQVCVTNLGANVAYVRVSSAGGATAADYPVSAGAQSILTKADDDVRMSTYSPGGTTLHIMTGNGW